jgi:hypothetical protein
MRPQQESVYTLPIGDPRRQYLLTVRPDEIVDTHRRRAVSLAEMTRLLEPATFILIGELHDNALHHQFQAQVIEALVQAGRSVIVGMEMFDRTKQPALNLWTLNRLARRSSSSRASGARSGASTSRFTAPSSRWSIAIGCGWWG